MTASSGRDARKVSTYQHDAFISYSTVATGQIGAALEVALEGLGRRWDEPRARDIFRDVSDQPATADLAAEIINHLEGSRFFVFLASSAAAASPWVRAEVQHWMRTRGVDSVLLAIAEGNLIWDSIAGCFDPASSLPPELLEAFGREPKWVDLRWASTGFDPSSDRFLDNVADLAAVLADLPKDQLVGLHWREYRKGLARRLAEDASTVAESSPDLSLLLSSAANRLDDCAVTRRTLAGVLEATSSLHGTPLGPGERVTAMAASPRRDEVVLGYADGVAAHWDATSGFETRRHRPGPPIDVVALACSGDGLCEAVGYADGTVLVTSGDEVVWSWPGDGIAVHQIAVDANSPRVAWASGERAVCVQTGDTCVLFEGFINIRKVQFSETDHVLVYDWSTLYDLDVSRREAYEVCSLPALPRPGPVAFTAGGDRVVFTQLDGGGINIRGVRDDAGQLFMQGPPGFIDAVAFDADGTFLAQATGGEVLVWDAQSASHTPLNRYAVSVGAVRQLALGPGGAWLAVLGDNRFELHSQRKTTLTRQLARHEIDVPSIVQAALDVAFSPDDSTLACVTNPTHRAGVSPVSVWSTSTYASVGRIEVSSPATLEYLDEESVRVGDIHGNLSLWRVTGERRDDAGQPVPPAPMLTVVDLYEEERLSVSWAGNEIDSIAHPPVAMQWCVDRSHLRIAISQARTMVTVRDVEARVDLWSVPVPSCADITFSPDGLLLAAVTSRGRLLVLDVGSGQIAARLDLHEGPLHVARFSHSGRHLAVASPGGPVTLVNTDIASWRAIADTRAARRFTSEELAAFGLDRILL